MILAAVHRGHDVLIPDGALRLEAGDLLILCAEPPADSDPVVLRELELLDRSPWNGQLIRDLDISRQTLIVLIRRGGRLIVPKGSTRLKAGDVLLLHTREGAVPDSTAYEI